MTIHDHVPAAPSRRVEDGFRGPRVCELVGITYRMLDYWARTDLIRPSISEARGSGTQRRYSAADVGVLLAIRRLLDAGVSLQSIRPALPVVRAALEEGRRWLVIIDGRAATCDAEQLADVVASGRISVVLDLSEQPEPSPTPR